MKAVAAEGCVVTHVDYDAMSFASVRAAAKTVLAATPELDVLANNAGVMALQDKATTDGFDLQMQTNHLSHFLLAKELYPAVKAAAKTVLAATPELDVLCTTCVEINQCVGCTR